jgi:hypothetical protein
MGYREDEWRVSSKGVYDCYEFCTRTMKTKTRKRYHQVALKRCQLNVSGGSPVITAMAAPQPLASHANFLSLRSFSIPATEGG